MRRFNLKDKVERILELYPETRNSDITLTIEIWKRYYPELMMKSEKNNEIAVNIKNIYRLPREDHVKRYRAKIQNDELRYLPTSAEVAKQRKINENVWRGQMVQPKIVMPYKD